MAGNSESKAASDSEDADRVYTLAHVLEQEFHALHQRDTPQQPRHSEAISDTKQQQPLADPSLAPSAKRIGAEPSGRPETNKAPSQQPDIDPDAAALRKLWENVHALAGDGRSALCLSGGGVRSAAFNLGVLQGLARLGLLGRFHYLSTVSGGGYIGCWLSAWRHRSKDGIQDVSRGLAWPDHLSDAEVSPRVPEAISNLRRATNYLTPVKGLLSPDTWATITIVGRNLILNHLVIVPLIAAALLIVKFFGASASSNRLSDFWEPGSIVKRKHGWGSCCLPPTWPAWYCPGFLSRWAGLCFQSLVHRGT